MVTPSGAWLSMKRLQRLHEAGDEPSNPPHMQRPRTLIRSPLPQRLHLPWDELNCSLVGIVI